MGKVRLPSIRRQHLSPPNKARLTQPPDHASMAPDFAGSPRWLVIGGMNATRNHPVAPIHQIQQPLPTPPHVAI
eukprot:6265900-Amphidinium_carterae.1